MRSICLFFQIHNPIIYRQYRFFEVGNDHFYENSFDTKISVQKAAEETYLPANALLLDLIIESKGALKVAFSISGMTMELFENYSPEVIESFRALNATGCVEFVGGTYTNSLCSLIDNDLFKTQVEKQSSIVERLFGERPAVFANSGLIYSDDISEVVAELGFNGVITEGAKHIMGWKSPNFLYNSTSAPELKVLVRNYKLSNDITLNFSNREWAEYPLTSDKYIGWLGKLNPDEKIINLFMEYQTIGKQNSKESGIFEFFEAFIKEVAESDDLSFATPSEIIENNKVESSIHVHDTISWSGEERGTSRWLGNSLQKEAFDKLYSFKAQVEKSNDPLITQEWNFLQSSSNFVFMSNKQFGSHENSTITDSPYASPYEAFINYMNIINDLKIRLDEAAPQTESDKKAATLNSEVKKLQDEIKELKKLNRKLKSSKK